MAGARRHDTADAHVGTKINLDAVLASPDALDPEAVARTLEPAESGLLRLLLLRPYLRDLVANAPRSRRLRDDPGARAVEGDRPPRIAVGFDRADLRRLARPDAGGMVAQTLFARPIRCRTTKRTLRQAVEQSLLSLRRKPHRRADRLRTQSSWPKPKPTPTPTQSADCNTKSSISRPSASSSTDERKQPPFLTNRRTARPAAAVTTTGGTD